MVQSQEQVLRMKENVKMMLEYDTRKVSPELNKSCVDELHNRYDAVVESEVTNGANTSFDDAVATSSKVAAIYFKQELSVSEVNDEEAGS